MRARGGWEVANLSSFPLSYTPHSFFLLVCYESEFEDTFFFLGEEVSLHKCAHEYLRRVSFLTEEFRKLTVQKIQK